MVVFVEKLFRVWSRVTEHDGSVFNVVEMQEDLFVNPVVFRVHCTAMAVMLLQVLPGRSCCALHTALAVKHPRTTLGGVSGS